MQFARLNLGCGETHIDGYINCDQFKTDATDIVFDVQKLWPFHENSVQEIVSVHMLEHLKEPYAFFEHAWHALIPNGRLHLQLPYGNSKSAWWDLHHIRPWYAESFCSLQPGYGYMINNPEHHNMPTPYMVACVSLRVSKKFARLCRFRFLRRFILPNVHHLEDGITELMADLIPLKTPEAIEQFHKERLATTVPIRMIAFLHDMQGTNAPGHAVPIVDIGEGMLGVPGEF